MPNSLARQVMITCTNCNQSFDFDVWLIVDGIELPDLLARIRQGALHTVICPHCSHSPGSIDAPLLIYRPDQTPPLVFSTAQQTSQEQDQQQAAELIGHLRETADSIRDDEQVVMMPRELLPQAVDDLEGALQQVAQQISGAVPPDVQAIVRELSQPSPDPRDMPHRIDLCRQALAMLPREQNPQLWATLQSDLGNSLTQSQLGDRSENLEQAIRAHRDALAVLTRQDFPVEWARAMMNLAIAHYSRIQGSRADNIEQAIGAYQDALAVLTRQDFPIEWAHGMASLATAYYVRIRGNRAENLELAIQGYQDALTVRTRQDFPFEWGQITTNLANAYSDRIQGNRSENLEQAISAYQDALLVRTRPDFPTEWAHTTAHLASAHYARIRGDKAENIERAIRLYQDALTVQTRQDFPIEWAQTTMNLASAYYSRIRGIKAENLELAISAYQDALAVLTRQDFPVDWARATTNLANAYFDRIRGDKAENLELAISAYQDALTVRTRQDLPIDWALATMNLGNTYYARIRGDKAENIELAIRLYQDALAVQTRQDLPIEWGHTTMNLANAYYARIRGDRAENLEWAIRGYQDALTVRTMQDFPFEWAQTMENLANVYLDRIRGDRAENIELALRDGQEALTVFTRQGFPSDWAYTTMNLANAYQDRIQGDKAENIERAIRAYQDALTVLTRQDFPFDWAQVTMNLANAYLGRIQGDPAENIELAIHAFQDALTVWTRHNFPIDWGLATMNLGNAYQSRIRGDTAENLELAIHAYQDALMVRTRQDFPVDWATTMRNLAAAYYSRVRGDRAENIEQAIRHYSQVLEIQSPDTLPADCLMAQRSLGYVYFCERRWAEACTAYTAAINVGNSLLKASYSEAGRQAEVAETATLYARAAYCLLQSKQYSQALIQLEAGKTRLLAEALALSDSEADMLPKAQQQALADLRRRIRDLESEMRLPSNTPARRSDRDLADRLRQARADLNTLVADIRADYPDFMPMSLDLVDMLSLIPEGGALVAPLVTSQGGAVFIVPHGAQIVSEEHVIRLDHFTDDELNAILTGSDEVPGWSRIYANFRQSGTRDAQMAWLKAIEEFTGRLWGLLSGPVHQRLADLKARRVLLMPSGGLQLLPLHAAWREVDGRKCAFLDDYEVTYVPSSYALDICRRRAEGRSSRAALVAGIDVYESLPPLFNACVEAKAIAATLNTQPLLDQAATLNAIQEAAAHSAYLHFSCHGSYAWGSNPFDSALYLAGDRPLKLSEIIGGKLDLKVSRLVTLSACETGVTDVSQSPDEYVGMPAGFLQAGAPAVVSSLWTVDDESTLLLMERFYQNHLERKMDLAAALRDAQLWLRDEKGYTSPFYWAAFTFTGA